MFLFKKEVAMDYRRIILYIALAMVGYSLWTAWQQDYPMPKAAVSTVAQQQAPQNPNLPPSAVTQSVNKTAAAPAASATTSAATVTKVVKQHIITVNTDTLSLKIDTAGGNVVEASLPRYPVATATPQIPTVLLSDAPEKFYIAQSGLLGKTGPDTQQGQAEYTTAQTAYVLTPDQNTLQVDLRWLNSEGLTITKRFTFHRNSYVVEVSYLIDNKTSQPWIGNFYSQIQRKKPPSESMFSLHSYEGATFSNPGQKNYQKLDYSDMDKGNLNLAVKGGWIAMQQRYFLSAWVPEQSATNQFFSQVNGDIYTIGFISQPIQVAPNAQATTGVKFYVGPETASVLKNLAPHLELTIDYGWLWIISAALFWVMDKIHSLVGNWGWSIVLVTLLIKLVFYKLSEASYRSMARMRQLQPRLEMLKERYGDDKQKMSQATMELYRKEKVNPLGGCLPMLIQIPVFIGLYYVLAESVELRQAPFILWIQDLSVRDPYFVLPILMGISMFLQQKLSPPPPDPMMAKMMMVLPIIFTVFFATFPAGLVLYWLVNNCLSILQQWYIMRRVEQMGSGKQVSKNKKR